MVGSSGKECAESWLSLLVQEAPVGLFIWEGGSLRYVNPACDQLLGDAGSTPATGRDLFERVHPEDRSALEAAVKQALEARTGTARCEARPPCDTARERRVEIELRRVTHQGRILLLGAVLDVTERRRWEERLANERAVLRTLVDHLPVAIYLKDTATRKTLVNPVDQRNLGVRSEAEALGRTDFEFFPREQAEAFYADDMQVLTTGVPVLNREERITRPDGSSGWLLTSKVPLRDTSGRIIGLAGIGLDITDRKLADEKLRAFAAQLERSNRELQDFAYVASHDLQEPLRKIVVFGERLCERYAEAIPPEARDYLERMRRAAQRMQTLINDLLAFSRVTTRARPFEPVDLGQVLREVLGDLEARIEQAGAVVSVEPLPVLEADPLQMRQLFLNLLGNALKFRKPDVPPRVRVHAEPVHERRSDRGPESPPEAFYRISVEDNGIGFDEKYLDRIFNMFQRLHGRGEYEGSGIGLAIARKIVLRHGGHITARSRPGEGATFIVTLPVHQPASNNPHA
ncbi:sensor histidine kinase [Limisphaera sp. 4302-co]|uniref:sensor histidine kinase n=1 Tax=Limisphaera sp. 4302-co TaxID=3400417 RepID=UPI003C21D957